MGQLKRFQRHERSFRRIWWLEWLVLAGRKQPGLGKHGLKRIRRGPIWWWWRPIRRRRIWWAAVMSAKFYLPSTTKSSSGESPMSYVARNQKVLAAQFSMFAALFLAASSLVSCGKAESPKTEQKNFNSPAEAGDAFQAAAKAGDQSALLAIFGPDSKNVLFSGDAVKDKDALQDFVSAHDQMHRWREIKVGGEILYVGADNFPFPVPLGKNPSGQWVFDTAAGKDEILARRIGKDELSAIAACSAVATAQQAYFGQTHDGDKTKQYAQKFISDDGKQNGLYWPVAAGQPPSPLEDA